MYTESLDNSSFQGLVSSPGSTKLVLKNSDDLNFSVIISQLWCVYTWAEEIIYLI